MSKCREIELLLAAYIDGEAAPPQRAAVDAHIERCPPCLIRVRSERTARTVIITRRVVLRGFAPDDLHARCASLRGELAAGVNRPSGRSGWMTRSRWASLALAATVLLAVGALMLFGLNDNVEALASQLALDHVKCFQFAGGETHLDASAAGRQWAESQGWSLEVPSSAPAVQLELRNVRRCLTTDGRVAHLMYKWRGEPLSVFVLPHMIKGVGDVQRIVERFGQQAVVWSGRGRTYVVMANGQRGDFSPVLGYVKATAR